MLTRIAPLLFALVFATACGESAPASLDLGSTPTAVAPSDLEPLRGFNTMDELFDEQITVSLESLRQFAESDPTDAEMDAVIRREGGRLIRVMYEVIADNGRKFREAQEACEGCILEPYNFSHWIDAKLVRVDAFVREQESERLASPRPRPLATLDDIRVALAPFIVDAVQGDYSQRPDYLALYRSNLGAAEPVASPGTVSTVHVDPFSLYARNVLWLTESPDWQLNLEALSIPVTEFEYDRPEIERRSMSALIRGLIERDRVRYDEARGSRNSTMYEFAAAVLSQTPSLSDEERQRFEATSARYFVANQAEAITAQVHALRDMNVEPDIIETAADVIRRSEFFDEDNDSHKAMLRTAEELAAYMRSVEDIENAIAGDMIEEQVAANLIELALAGDLNGSLSGQVFTAVVRREIDSGYITIDQENISVRFSAESFFSGSGQHTPAEIEQAARDHPELLTGENTR